MSNKHECPKCGNEMVKIEKKRKRFGGPGVFSTSSTPPLSSDSRSLVDEKKDAKKSKIIEDFECRSCGCRKQFVRQLPIF